jgi:hypothetical protein
VRLCDSCHALVHGVEIKNLRWSTDGSSVYSDSDKRDVLRLYEKGYSARLISQITGVGYWTVRRTVKAAGGQFKRGRPPGNRKEFYDDAHFKLSPD